MKLKPCLERDAPATCISLGDISPCDNCFSNLMGARPETEENGDEPMTDKTKSFEFFDCESFESGRQYTQQEFTELGNRMLNEQGVRCVNHKERLLTWISGHNIIPLEWQHTEALIICRRKIEKDAQPQCEGLCEGLSNILKSPYEVEVVTNNFCPKCGKDLR